LLAKEDFANDAVDAGEIGSGHSVTALYEVTLVNDDQAKDQEMMKVNLRYKQPKGSVSTLIEHKVPVHFATVENASKDMKFASSVALFGMLNRNSKYTGAGDMKLVQKLAEQGVGKTDTAARIEFLNLSKKNIRK